MNTMYKRVCQTLFLTIGILFVAGCSKSGPKTYKIGVIPKFIAEDYFIAAERGFKKAGEELGIQVDWVGDTMSQTSAANQKNYIQSFIDKRYDAILVSALDPESYAEALREAREKGILVITWDADVNPSARDYFVNQAEGDQIAIQLLKGLAGDLSDYSSDNQANITLVSTTTDSPNQNAWIEAIVNEYNQNRNAEYSHINLLADQRQIVYAGNDQGTADEKIKALLTANTDINGIIALSSNTVPAVSTARDQLGIENEIKIIGVSVPESSRSDMQEGKISAVVLWQPYDLGYLSVYVAAKALQGKENGEGIHGSYFKSPLSGTNMTTSFLDGSTMINYPAEGHKILPDNTIILGDPIVWNLKNIDRFRGYPQADSGMGYFLK